MARPPHEWRRDVSQAGQPDGLPGFCDDARSSNKLKQPIPPMPVNPFPKDRLAITRVPLEPIESVNPTSPEWAALPTALLEEFNDLEDRTISQVRTFRGSQHPLPAGQRRTIPIRLESSYRSPTGNLGGPCRMWRSSGSTRPVPGQRLWPRDVCERLGAPSRRQAGRRLATERQVDLLRPCWRHVPCSRSAHSAQEQDLLGISALGLGDRIVRRRGGSSKMARYVLEVFPARGEAAARRCSPRAHTLQRASRRSS